MRVNIIVAMCKSRGIGINGSLPWSIKEDMKHFVKTTIGNGNNAIVMGRKTWDSINKKPLKNRLNFVVSRSEKEVAKINSLNYNNVFAFTSIESVLNYCNSDELWVIGGSQIYNEFISNYSHLLNLCVITYIDNQYECDAFFPELSNKWSLTKKDSLEKNIYVQYWIKNNTIIQHNNTTQ
jgi:dihydrofolate reductase